MTRVRIQHPGDTGVGKVQQHHAESADINSMVKKASPGYQIGDPRATTKMWFMDVPSESFHESLNRVCQVRNQFATLPAKIRGKFMNDPLTLLKWLEEAKNRPEALKMGLLMPTNEEAVGLANLAAKYRRTEQVDLIREAMKPQTPVAPKADPEANPSFRTPQAPQGD